MQNINEREKLFRLGVISLNDVRLIESVPIEKYIEEYIDYKKSIERKPKTISLHKLALRTFKEYLEGRDISLLSKADYLPLLQWMKNAYPNKVTRNIRLRDIRAFLYWLVEFDYIDSIPFKIKQEKQNVRVPRYFSAAEIKEILIRAKACKNDLFSRIIVHLNTGIRLGEVRTSYLQENGFLHVYEEKTNTEKDIAIDSNTAEHFRICKQSQHLDEYYSKKFLKIIRDLKLYILPDRSKRTFHCLRHTYAVSEYVISNNIYRVSQLLGHQSVKTTEIYVASIDSKLAYDFPDSMEYKPDEIDD